MKKTIIFYVLCLITAVLFFKCFFLVNKPTSYVAPIYNTMNVILGTQTKSPTDVIIKINNDFSEIPKSKNVLNKTIEGKVNSLDILIKKDFKNEIKDIIIFNDIKVYYFKDFSSFKKEEIKLCPMGNCSAYIKYEVPKSVKYNKNSDTYNYRSNINTISNIILFPMSGHFVFFIPYILLFISMIYYITNKDEIKKPKINPHVFVFIIAIIAVILRLNGLFDYEPWADEYWSLHFSNPNYSVLKIFDDPGNPPLFYLITRIYMKIFGNSLISIKILPFVIGILALFSLWCFLYKEYGKKAALMGFFIAAINAPLIYYSTEIRGYILQVLFTPVLIYFLFKIFKEGKNKYFICYGVLVAFVVNLHYYEILLIFANFIYGGIFLLIKKRKKDFIKFFLSNLIGGLFLLPFFIKTAFNKALMEGEFNTWLPDLTFEQIRSCIYYVFGGFFSLLLSFVFFIKSLFNSKNKLLIFYSYAVIWLVIITAILLSYLIRPMLLDRYFLLLVPIFIIFIVAVFISQDKKYSIILFIIWILLIQSNTLQKSYSSNNRKVVLEMPFDVASKYPKAKHVNVITNTFLEEQKKYSKYDKNIKYSVSSVKTAIKDINIILNKDKNAIIFTSILPPDKKYPDNYTCYFNSASDMCLWRIEND